MTLDEIRALIEAATPGPWELRMDWEFGSESGKYIGSCSSADVFDGERNANAAFIAASRTLLPKLLDVVMLHQDTCEVLHCATCEAVSALEAET